MNPINRIVLVLRGQMARSARQHHSHIVGTDIASPKPVARERREVANRTRGTILADQLEIADTAPSRNKGLLGRDRLARGQGLWIIPCESVHTFFMRFPIDLVYLDRKNRIKKLRSAVGPWRISACLAAHSVLELPAGTIRESRTEVGDTLDFLQAFARESSSPGAQM